MSEATQPPSNRPFLCSHGCQMAAGVVLAVALATISALAFVGLYTSSTRFAGMAKALQLPGAATLAGVAGALMIALTVLGCRGSRKEITELKKKLDESNKQLNEGQQQLKEVQDQQINDLIRKIIELGGTTNQLADDTLEGRLAFISQLTGQLNTIQEARTQTDETEKRQLMRNTIELRNQFDESKTTLPAQPREDDSIVLWKNYFIHLTQIRLDQLGSPDQSSAPRDHVTLGDNDEDLV